MNRSMVVVVVGVTLLLVGCTSKRRMESEIAIRESTIAEMQGELEQKI